MAETEQVVAQGGGRCTVPDCGCPYYHGEGQVCTNCGHSWTQHA